MTIRSLVTEKGATVVDVRGTWEFEDGHIEGALNIPLDEIPMRIEELKQLKMPLVVYCKPVFQKFTMAADLPICE